MSAGKYDITIDQGSDFELTLVIKDGGTARDLSGWNARGKLKSTYDAEQSYDFTFTGSGGGSLGDDGTIVMKMANTVTDDITAGFYVYDVEIYEGTSVERIIQGKAEVTREVTD